ncbi:FtsH protease activity modulator HflK [Neiella marina]|uniref:Protein HflK n=1 Tax=Neiella holothuriorum TaxID=2870530 RepID=A0ABS7EFN8_9GAMM|nr:FtsH protease activity modulator HflK [Neiella holothuriorum]MBW8191030.1 FtsH protease activity modulator HflK [Neiella holothuriorum]
MAWHEPGGNKPNDPWKGKKSGNQGPPDLDEVLTNLSKKLGGKFGGGRGGRGGNDSDVMKFGGGLVVIIALLVWAFSGLYTVREAELGVKLRFGGFVDNVQPGLHWKPTFIDEVTPVDVRSVSSMPTSGFMLTKDENVVRIEMDVQYRVTDPYLYLYSVMNPEDTLLQAMDSALRYVVGHNTMDNVLTSGREQVRSETWQELSNIIDPYRTGLEIVDLNVQLARPPEEVKDAFDDAISAQEDEERFVREAEAYAREVEPQARGQVKRILEDSNAYKQKKVLDAQGDVARFNLILPEYTMQPEITRKRLYLETIEKVYSNTSKVLVDIEGGNNLMYLPLDKIMKSTPQTSTKSAFSDSNRSSRAPVSSSPSSSRERTDRFTSGSN